MKTRGIHIVGGGLAGLSLAVGLRIRGVGVVVSEAGCYPRHRVCGEFISGVADATLESLGVLDAFEGSLRPASLSWWHRDRLLFDGRLPVPARAISRYRLDDRLANLLIAAGGELRTRERLAVAGGEGWVWAAGRPKRAGATRIGLKAHVRGPRLRAELEMHAGHSGYAGLTEVEDGWINVCGIFKADRTLRVDGTDGEDTNLQSKPKAKGAALLAAYLEAGGCRQLADTIRCAELREGSSSAIAGFEPGAQPERVGELCIGDSDRMIPPFTGNGMSMAFESAECALGPLVAWARDEVSWVAAANATRAALVRKFRTRMSAAMWLEPTTMRDAAANALAFFPPAVMTRAVLPLLR